MTNKPHDKRTQKRVPFQILVSYEHKGTKFDNFSYNFSRGGIFIETLNPLEVGSEINLSLEIPLKKVKLICQGQVVWTSPNKSPQGMGIEFVNFSPRMSQLLDETFNELEKVA